MSPLDGALLGGTVAAWIGARAIAGRVRHPLLHPVLLAGLPLAALLASHPAAAARYATATRPLSLLLGPAVVGFATQLYARRRDLAAGGLRLGAVFVAAAAVSVVLGASLARLAGADAPTVRSLIPAHATSPIAAALADAWGGRGPVAIAACMVIGMSGALVGPILRRRLGLSDAAYGAALGTSAHGIGTGAALEHSPAAGASAGLALVVQALLVAVFAPIAVALFAR